MAKEQGPDFDQAVRPVQVVEKPKRVRKAKSVKRPRCRWLVMLAGNTQPGLRVTKGRYQLSDFVREYRGPKMVPTNKGGVDHVMPIAPLRGSLADEVEATLKAMVA